MSDYQNVTAELDRGTPPDVLCATCPWSRPCIQPPTMTRQQIEKQVNDIGQRSSRDEPNPMGGLLTALFLAGKDTAAQVCPVFALRLASPDGRRLADGLREQMREWQPTTGEG